MLNLGLFLMPATLPGRSVADARDWNLDVVRQADRVGYDQAWIGQHFTTPWKPIMAPQQLIWRLRRRHPERLRIPTEIGWNTFAGARDPMDAWVNAWVDARVDA